MKGLTLSNFVSRGSGAQLVYMPDKIRHNNPFWVYMSDWSQSLWKQYTKFFLVQTS
jgi:hypothetical protein